MHVVTNGKIFICMPEQYLIVFAYIYLSTHLPKDILVPCHDYYVCLPWTWEVQISLQDILRIFHKIYSQKCDFYYFDSSLLNFLETVLFPIVFVDYILTNSTECSNFSILVNHIILFIYFVKKHHWFNGYLIGSLHAWSKD